MIKLTDFDYREQILNLETWKSLKFSEIQIIVDALHLRVKDVLSLVNVKLYGFNDEMDNIYIPSFLHKISGLRFQFIPGGKFIFGLSPNEEDQLRKLSHMLKLELEDKDYNLMKPALKIQVPPFLYLNILYWKILRKTR